MGHDYRATSRDKHTAEIQELREKYETQSILTHDLCERAYLAAHAEHAREMQELEERFSNEVAMIDGAANDEIKKLGESIETLYAMKHNLHDLLLESENEIEKLRAENKELEKYKTGYAVLKEAVDFYAKPYSWLGFKDNKEDMYEITKWGKIVYCDHSKVDGDFDNVGGKRAREASKRAALTMGGSE